MRTETGITKERLQQILDYAPDTGVFTWRQTLSNRAQAGSEAGAIKSNGYRSICINGKLVHAHRLAFLYMEGTFPDEDVDHINGIRDDNRWFNLRRATRIDNMRNARLSRSNTSGITGVSWHKAASKWVARIRTEYTTIHLGLFENFDEAVAARKSAEREYGFHTNHGGPRHV